MRVFLAAMLLVGVATPAEAQQAPHTVVFNSGPAKFEATIPAGYCVTESEETPAGKADLELIQCGDTAREHDFYSIKRSPGFSGRVKTLDQLFTELRPMFNAPDAEERFAALSDKAAQKNGLELDGGWKPMGMDDTCAYIGAQVTLEPAGVSLNYVQAICATVIGGEIFAIYSTGEGSTVEDLARHIRNSKAMALAIRRL